MVLEEPQIPTPISAGESHRSYERRGAIGDDDTWAVEDAPHPMTQFGESLQVPLVLVDLIDVQVNPLPCELLKRKGLYRRSLRICRDDRERDS